jgi:Mce-associated membrane protein
LSPIRSRRSPVHNEQNATPHALVLAEAAEAEAEATAAEALAVAAHARARALRLRRAAAAMTDLDSGDASPVDSSTHDAQGGAEDDLPGEREPADNVPAVSAIKPRWHLPGRPRRRLAAAAVAVLFACAMFGVGGRLLWQHREKLGEQQRTAEFAAAARQGVVTLMSMDFAHAKDDVQRVIDDSTGSFKDDFVKGAKDFIAAAQQSQLTTVTTVNAAAVKSMATDSANVLVAATSEVTNAAGAKQEPRAWRLVVTVTRDADQLKLSKVEFVQ